MIFRQLFDSVSSTYSYVLASRRGGEALIIDPVLEKVDRYLKLMEELDLRLVKAVDTHLHADHITGLGALRDRTRCVTVMGEQSQGRRRLDADRRRRQARRRGPSLDVLYTPGHTDECLSFVFGDRVFTGDTLFHSRHRTHRLSKRRFARPIRSLDACCRSPRRPSSSQRTTIRATR